MAAGSMRRSVARWAPIVAWLPRYDRSLLSGDIIAGFTIWGLLIPEMIAYASLAGLPPQAGLYTLLASLALYAIFGTSRQLVVAGTSASAVLVFSAVTGLHPENASDYATLAAAMIIFTGLALVLSGMLRLGFITEFLSRPVMSGFIFGLAIFVTVSQLPKIFGIGKGEGDTVRQFFHILANLGNASVVTFAVGIGALVLLFALERFMPRIPGGLVVLVLSIAISHVVDLSSHGVAIVGHIPTGFPSVSIPHVGLSDLWVLLPSSLGMLLVIYSEALGAATTFAEKYGNRIDSNQEMIALGLANIGSGLLGGLAAGGSLSQTAVNDGAGAKSEVSPLCAAVLSLITVLAFTPLFHDLPEAVLAALIIHAVSHLMKVGEMREYYRLNRGEFGLGAITLVGVIVLDVLPGLLIGVLLSLVLVIGRASRPKVSVLGQSQEFGGAYVDIERNPDARTVEGILIVRPDAPLFYANAQAVRDAIDADLAKTEATVVVLDLDENDNLDITTAEHLVKLQHELARRQIQLCLARVHTPVLRMAEATGLLDAVGPEHVFAKIDAAVTWTRARPSS
jgi:high affinity sulfate transporter 1